MCLAAEILVQMSEIRQDGGTLPTQLLNIISFPRLMKRKIGTLRFGKRDHTSYILDTMITTLQP